MSIEVDYSTKENKHQGVIIPHLHQGRNGYLYTKGISILFK